MPSQSMVAHTHLLGEQVGVAQFTRQLGQQAVGLNREEEVILEKQEEETEHLTGWLETVRGLSSV